MNDNPFKEGDKVRLKSGGPDMTVNRNLSFDTFECKWWDESTKKFCVDRFNSSSLEKCDVESSSTQGE